MTTEEKEIARFRKILDGENGVPGLTHNFIVVTKRLDDHIAACTKAHEEAAKRAEEKKVSDINWYKGIIATVIGGIIVALALAWLGFKPA